MKRHERRSGNQTTLKIQQQYHSLQSKKDKLLIEMKKILLELQEDFSF